MILAHKGMHSIFSLKLGVTFFVSRQKVQNIDKNSCRQMFKGLEPFRNVTALVLLYHLQYIYSASTVFIQ
jgi:hypothetical protein